MSDIRPQKTWRMSYWLGSDSAPEPAISILSNPGEIRAGVGPKSFISIKEDSITFQPGVPAKFNVQGLKQSWTYAGLIQDLPWPLTMIPSTGVTPLPQQIFKPPLRDLIRLANDIANLSTGFLL